jgi:NAD-dependent deacetylase
LEELADKLADLIVNSEKIVVFTGAGHSTESGIPDFRSPGGIWSKYDPSEFTYQKFLGSAENRKQHWKFYQTGTFFDESNKPNPAHYAIAELEKMGKLTCVITQNVDNLLQQAGVPEEKVIELHGNMKRVKCLSCGKRYLMSEIMERVNQGLEEPRCDDCQGILKPETVYFGEAMPQKALSDATMYSSECDLFIVIGSSLVVYPAAYMPSYAVDAGAKLAIVNLTPTHMDNEATLIIQAMAGEVMSKTLEKVKEKLRGEK